MKKLVGIISIVVLSYGALFAQDYQTGLGLRLGFFSGVTVKHFVTDQSAIEGILSSRWGGFNVVGLYELHYELPTEGLNWYFGFGAHAGFWSGPTVYWADNNVNYAIIGVDGILGMEYNFTDYPINISLDWKPAINLIGYTGFWADGGALSVRYIF